MSTNSFSRKQIKRNWHLFDAKTKILGRLAGEIAILLRGKNKPSFVPYLDMGDYVVVINASQVKVTGKKEQQKMYYRHSGYPGGLKSESLAKLRVRRPEEVIRHAVKGMLPSNKLGDQLIKKLYIYSGSEHPFAKQFSSKTTEEVKEEAAVAVA